MEEVVGSSPIGIMNDGENKTFQSTHVDVEKWKKANRHRMQ